MKKLIKFILILAVLNVIGGRERTITLPTFSEAADFAVSAAENIKEIIQPYYSI